MKPRIGKADSGPTKSSRESTPNSTTRSLEPTDERLSLKRSTSSSTSSGFNSDQDQPSLTSDGIFFMQDFQQQTMCSLITLFTTYAKIHRLPNYDFLLIALESASPTSSLHRVWATVSFTNHINRHGRGSPFLREQEVYGQALASLNTALQDPVECVKDETLVSVGARSSPTTCSSQ